MPNLDISSPLKCDEAFPCYSRLERSCSAHKTDTGALVGDQAAAQVLPVFLRSWETRGSAAWSTSILANKTHHHHILENTDPAGKPGSSVPGADSVTSLTNACCVRSCYQAGL